MKRQILHGSPVPIPAPPADHWTGNALADPARGGMVGHSVEFSLLLRQIDRIARTDAPVLIEGETGVGKELTARAIHYSSARVGKPFVALNCGAVPEALIESELFGHVRGAFTDAHSNRDGVVAQAHDGTLFLDEIDTLPGKGQVAMLRFLQEHCYRPVGQSAERTSHSRIIAATNQPLHELVRRGAFRSDLMYRLNIIQLRVPPLRERRADLAPLTRHYLKQYSERYGLPQRPLSAACWEWMLQHDWPGNIRELESMIHRAVLLSEGVEIVFEQSERARRAPAGERSAAAAHSVSACARDPMRDDFRSAKSRAIEAFEREYLTRLLETTRGNVTEAARLACKERRSVGRLIKKYGIATR